MDQRHSMWLAITIVLAALWAATATAEMADLRMWTDAASGKKVQAAMIRIEGESVVLKRATDGKTFSLPIARLAETDQQYIDYHRRETAAATAAASAEQKAAEAAEPPTDDRDAAMREIGDLTADTPLAGLSWNPLLAIILAVGNIPLVLLWGKLFFGDFHGFIESLHYVFKPDWISFWQGEGLDDFWATMKFNFFVVWCVITIAAQYVAIQKIF